MHAWAKGFSDYRYEIIAFGSGFAVMVLEVVGARLIAPHLGSSVYVWTAMIGVILGALAVGYWLGGKIADRPDSANLLYLYLVVSAAIILLLSFIYDPALSWLAGLPLDLRLQAFFAAGLLFAPPGFFLGCISPLLAKICVTSLTKTGHAIGRLEASGTAGSITGTFLTGYFLLAAMGSHRIVLGLAGLLLLLSFVAASRPYRLLRSALLATTVLLFIPSAPGAAGIIADIDTGYGRYRVLHGTVYGHNGYFLLSDNSGIQSGYDPSRPNHMVFPYTQGFVSIATQARPKRILMIGGGTHTFASAYMRLHGDVTIDVVEIDPALDKLARQYFGLVESPRLHIIHADGREYLNNTKTKYDLVILDAFNGATPPFQLTTLEAVQEIRRLLTPDGLVTVNFIARSPQQQEYFKRFVRTYDVVFPAYAVQNTSGLPIWTDDKRNFLLVAANDATRLSTIHMPDRLILGKVTAAPLRDDFAPVEQLTK